MMIEYHNRTETALASDFREITQAKIEGLGKYSSEILRTRIEVLDSSAHKQKSEQHQVSITVHTTHTVVQAEGAGLSNLVAFDVAFESVEAQFRKIHSKQATAKTRKPGIKNIKPKE